MIGFSADYKSGGLVLEREEIAAGGVDAIVERVRAHLDAGADHVCIQPLIAEQDRFPLAELRELAPALLSL